MIRYLEHLVKCTFPPKKNSIREFELSILHWLKPWDSLSLKDLKVYSRQTFPTIPKPHLSRCDSLTFHHYVRSDLMWLLFLTWFIPLKSKNAMKQLSRCNSCMLSKATHKPSWMGSLQLIKLTDNTMKLAAKVLKRKKKKHSWPFFQFLEQVGVKSKRENGYAKTGVSVPFLRTCRESRKSDSFKS